MKKIQPTKETIEALIARAQKGDHEAFSQVYLLFVDDIFRFCASRLGSIEEAEDATSETFKKAWSYLRSYKSDNFRAFLYAIARNVCVDFWKKQKPHSILSESIPAKEGSLEERLIHDDEIASLHQAIQKLPEEYQEVVILRCINELSIKDTAVVLGKSSIWVRVNQYRAIKKLKQLLKS